MRRAIGNTQKQSGKIVILSTAPAGNGTVTKAALRYSDTTYYQVAKHGDYVQEVN